MASSWEQHLSSGFPLGIVRGPLRRADALDRGADPEALSTLIFTVGLTLLNIDLVRAKVMPVWVAPVLYWEG